MAVQDWGSAGIDSLTPTTHSSPTASLSSSKTHLPHPFTVVIVGAAGLIGTGIATAYTRAGASNILLASRRRSELERTASACRALSSKVSVEAMECDITSADSVASLADHARQVFPDGRVDVVIVNSGYSGPVRLTLDKTDASTFQNAINVNYMGTFHVAKHFIPLLLATSAGVKTLIAISSIASLIVRGPIANAQYCVSKAAQLKLMEHIHEQYSGRGLASFSVHPGAVRSQMAEETSPAEFLQYLTDDPELCGAFCVWLTGDGRPDGVKRWLSGRLVSAKWDVEELDGMREQIEMKDLLKLKLALPG